MNDKDLDKKLSTARSQSERFFDKFDFDRGIRMVQRRIEENRGVRNGGIKRYITGRVPLAGAAAALTIALLLLVLGPVRHLGPANPGTPILQQAIGMDEERDSHMVNYFRFDNPNSDNNLLAVLWRKGSKGNYEVIYSSIMENAYTPNPVAVITIPSGESSFAFVSSSSKDENYIHYRLVKYSNSTVTEYLEENFVPSGKIQVINGMIFEERTIPADYNLRAGDVKPPNPGKAYRYFIPVELRSDGSFALATNRVRLKKGAILTLLTDILDEPPAIEYDTEVLGIKSNRTGGVSSSSIDFEAKKEGTASLKIGKKTGTDNANELFIEVVGP
ncbi:MAG TPA: hypothetical protein PLE53_00845 [Bacillota bacterium]|jgi:hypothetical protein|nr:hypothetical protein [Bacillota bacterium]